MEATILPFRRSNSGGHKSILLTTIVLALLLTSLLGLTSYVLWRDYHDALLRARGRAENTVGAMGEHARWIIGASQQALLRIDAAVGDPHNPVTWQVNDLRPLSAGLPPGTLVYICDANGLSLPERPNDRAVIDVKDRDYFKALVNGGTWYVGRQIITKVKKNHVFTIAKRIERNGVFAGVIAIALPVEWMTRFYETLGFGPESKIALTTLDGWTIASSPKSEESYSLEQFPRWGDIHNGESFFGDVDARSLDGQEYFLASRHVSPLPVIAVVALSKAEALAPFFSRLGYISAAAAAGFLVLLALSLWVLYLQRDEGRVRHDLAKALADKEESEASMRLALNEGQLGHWSISPTDLSVTFSEQMAKFLGFPPQKMAMDLEQAKGLVCPEDREGVSQAIDETINHGKRFKCEFRVRRADGVVRWMASQGNLLRDLDRRPVRVIGVCQDITDRKLADERQHLMIAELDHRVKNTLASVQSIAWQSLGRSNTTKVFAERIASLANAHSLLSESQWKGASLKTLLARQFAAYLDQGRNRIFMDGPDILLDARTTQSFCLVLHELMTNAAKYGALSTKQGHLSILWSYGEGDTLDLQWQERNGPAMQSDKKGFGSHLIEQSIRHELGGDVRLEQRPDGLTYYLSFPLPNVQLGEGEILIGEEPSLFADATSLNGKRIFLVEDSALVALDIQDLLERNGMQVVASAARLDKALAIAESHDFDGAILDVNLAGQMAFPIAEILHQRGIPFLFMSGYGDAMHWPDQWADIYRLSKPTQEKELFNALAMLWDKPSFAAAPIPAS